jgi:hypothetical protein
MHSPKGGLVEELGPYAIGSPGLHHLTVANPAPEQWRGYTMQARSNKQDNVDDNILVTDAIQFI